MDEQIRRFSERELISRIRDLVGQKTSVDLIKGIGDDCAVFRHNERELWLITTDTLTESVHFEPAWHKPFLLGRKTASVNISDVAAMGGSPQFALLTMAVPDQCAADWLEDFLAGFTAVLQEYKVMLIGGDTVRSGRDTVFSVTIIGSVDKERILYRSCARPDDLIWVSGPLGEAAAGLEFCRRGFLTGQAERAAKWQRLIKAHLDPVPRVRLGRLIADSGRAHAMIDLSDGLATDLAHLCRESMVGAEVYADKLPLSKLLVEAAATLRMSALDLALKGGEDYQLLFTAPATAAEVLGRLAADCHNGTIYPIGRITAGGGVFLCREGAPRQDISYQGYDHFTGR